MPEYLYRDRRGHEQTMLHRMLYSTAVICDTCGETMRRVIQMPRINWNGNRATFEASPAVRELIETAPERRDKHLAGKERHASKTKDEQARQRESDPTYGTVHHTIRSPEAV